mgnify:CR=1 FL=1
MNILYTNHHLYTLHSNISFSHFRCFLSIENLCTIQVCTLPAHFEYPWNLCTLQLCTLCAHLKCAHLHCAQIWPLFWRKSRLEFVHKAFWLENVHKLAHNSPKNENSQNQKKIENCYEITTRQPSFPRKRKVTAKTLAITILPNADRWAAPKIVPQ